MAAAKPLMSAQRYPYDFDGIAAGAPANNMDVQNTHHHANRLLTNQAVPGYIPLPQRNTYVLLQGNLPYIHAKVVAACDGLDGVLDGVIDDPRNCKFDTNTLVCANNGNEPGCLSQAQADAVFRIHDGAKTLDGVRLAPELSARPTYRRRSARRSARESPATPGRSTDDASRKRRS